MVRFVQISLLVCGLLLGNIAKAQVEAFATVKVSPREVVVKQPVKITITVLTATWFTSPLDYGNLQITNAFTIPFQRTQSGIHYIDKKKYAGLEFYYIVFPYEAGEFTFPPLEIKTTSPPEGDYKAVPVTIRTKAVTFKVNEVPAGKDADHWMVAKSVFINEKWNKPLDKLKVGDVVERTITIRANGTLPSFIEPLDIEKPEFGSIYPKTAELKDQRDDKDANGTRIERYSYLLEKEGEFEVPAVKMEWWNPYLNKNYFRETKPRKISIQPNPDLDVLASLKDSLDALNRANAPEEEEAEATYFGLSLKELLVLLAIGLVVLWLLIKLFLRVIKWQKAKREAYRKSEEFWFDKFEKSVGADDPKASLNSLYAWYDRFRAGKYAPNLRDASSEDELEKETEKVEQALFHSPAESLPKNDLSQWAKKVGLLRKTLKKENSVKAKGHSLDGLNP
ncbi:BatD family protein [Flammeovirgaceae bacterium SG7u.111]|nr:BatD family protein [Flammeovirgaceae bacterium SG7u.132]WPO36270.1 BatD family protein [Flammeovirgaceae bacterium SG7u.111]